MNADEFAQFTKGAACAIEIPKRVWVRRIKSVRCLNPKQRISYSYDRIYGMTFEDGSKMAKGYDHWRKPGEQMKKGNYVVGYAIGMCECYLTPEEYRKAFSPL